MQFFKGSQYDIVFMCKNSVQQPGVVVMTETKVQVARGNGGGRVLMSAETVVVTQDISSGGYILFSHTPQCENVVTTAPSMRASGRWGRDYVLLSDNDMIFFWA